MEALTRKLYYENPYKFEFEARVIDSSFTKDRHAIVLDETCFYPEGGGQPSDQGWLNEARVHDVQYKNGEIIHYVDSQISEEKVKGKIEKDRRMDFMQQHTGQHILSQSLLRVGNINTVSVHFGENYITIETDAPSINGEVLSEVEILANKTINSNLPVNIHWVSPAEVEKFNIRRPPPEVEKIRVIEVEGFDFAACGGLHVSRSGEIGLVKIIGQEKIRNHVRIKALIGKRAYMDYDKKTKIVMELSQLMTCGEEFILDRVKDIAAQLKDTRRENYQLQSERIRGLADTLVSSAVSFDEVQFIQYQFDNVDNKLLKTLVDTIVGTPERIIAVINNVSSQIRWIVAHSLSRQLNLLDIIQPLFPIIDAKGGGKPDYIQGGGNKPSNSHEFLNQLKERLEKELVTNE
jgi:alanyl-tRNA synthetase